MFCPKCGQPIIHENGVESFSCILNSFESQCSGCGSEFQVTTDLQDQSISIREFYPEDREIPESAQAAWRLCL